MFKYLLITFVGFVAVGSAEPVLTPESHFFGIPNADSLCTPWFLAITDSTVGGFAHPVDIDVLELSPADYRLVILDAFDNIFTTFRIDQQNGVPPCGVARSGEVVDTSCGDAAAMCQMKRSVYFNPETDRIAVAFWYGAQVGIYRLDRWTGKLNLERTFANPAITKPIGIYWAFDNFFIVDEATESIFRTDSLGNIVSRYGRKGLYVDGYNWISDIDGYVDGSADGIR
jgi:hypothetical protein